MTGILRAYRGLAMIVGVLLVVLCLIGLPLNEAHLLNPAWFPVGSDAQQVGAAISTYLGVAHGWLYMIFVGVAFALSRRAEWPWGFTVGTILAGTVPVLSFWAERRATADVRRRLAAGPGDASADASGGSGAAWNEEGARSS